MKNIYPLAAVAALSVAFGAQAEAVLDLEYQGFGLYSSQRVMVKGSLDWNDDGATEEHWWKNLKTGDHRWLDDAGAAVVTHCIEIYANIPDGTTSFDVVNIADAPDSSFPGEMGLQRSIVLQDLFSRWIDPSTGAVGGGVAMATAFQLLTWEITHERFGVDATADEIKDRVSLDMGGIRWTADDELLDLEVHEFVVDMVDLLGFDGEWHSAPIDGLSSEFAQDQAMYVPAPGVLAAVGIGVAARMRRRRR